MVFSTHPHLRMLCKVVFEGGYWSAWTNEQKTQSFGGSWRIIPVSKWLITPVFISHLGHLEGVPQPYLGDLRSPCLLTTDKSWDDPPSGKSGRPNLSAAWFWFQVDTTRKGSKSLREHRRCWGAWRIGLCHLVDTCLSDSWWSELRRTLRIGLWDPGTKWPWKWRILMGVINDVS